MTMHHFWAQSGPFTSNNFFFRKPVNEPCFFYSCLSTCQKSKSDINLSVKYWWFKNTEISLAESHFCLYLRSRFFSSMQFSQDVNEPWELYFTQIPGKTNDMIFLKSPKTMFFGHVWPFLPDRDFFQKIQLSHTTIYGPLTLC